ncbi:MAG TPA: HutD family protein, partial [Dongiaceae bacterium]
MRIRAADYRAMAWKNGQGMTREIAREPGEGDFLWRLSIAEVAASGDFSLFPGYDRTITLIEGAGIRLAFAEAPEKAILTRFEPFDFSGDWHCRCS